MLPSVGEATLAPVMPKEIQLHASGTPCISISQESGAETFQHNSKCSLGTCLATEKNLSLFPLFVP